MRAYLIVWCVAGLVWCVAATASAQIPNVIVGEPIRASDINGIIDAVNGQLTIPVGSLDLPPSTAATGNITKSGVRFLHNFGTNSTFLGVGAGNFTTTGDRNTAVGAGALPVNVTGTRNTATGQNALGLNMGGHANTAMGHDALTTNATGSNNTAVGDEALFVNLGGSRNTAVGADALRGTTGSDNSGLGILAGVSLTTGDHNIAIGHAGVAGASNTIWLGTPGTHTDTYLAGDVHGRLNPDPPCFDNTNRYVDCGNGTVTDTVSGLIWLANADCAALGNPEGGVSYEGANAAAAALVDGTCGLTDGSRPGDWRLATREEWWETIFYAATQIGCDDGGVGGPPSWTNDAGTACYGNGSSSSFTGVVSGGYWSSSTVEPKPQQAWSVGLDIGSVGPGAIKGSEPNRVWPVRGGPWFR